MNQRFSLVLSSSTVEPVYIQCKLKTHKKIIFRVFIDRYVTFFNLLYIYYYLLYKIHIEYQYNIVII